MFKITLIFACIYAVLILPISGFVAEPSVNSKQTVSTVADVPVARSTFVNNKQFFIVTTEKVLKMLI